MVPFPHSVPWGYLLPPEQAPNPTQRKLTRFPLSEECPHVDSGDFMLLSRPLSPQMRPPPTPLGLLADSHCCHHPGLGRQGLHFLYSGPRNTDKAAFPFT